MDAERRRARRGVTLEPAEAYAAAMRQGDPEALQAIRLRAYLGDPAARFTYGVGPKVAVEDLPEGEVELWAKLLSLSGCFVPDWVAGLRLVAWAPAGLLDGSAITPADWLLAAAEVAVAYEVLNLPMCPREWGHGFYKRRRSGYGCVCEEPFANHPPGENDLHNPARNLARYVIGGAHAWVRDPNAESLGHWREAQNLYLDTPLWLPSDPETYPRAGGQALDSIVLRDILPCEKVLELAASALLRLLTAMGA